MFQLQSGSEGVPRTVLKEASFRLTLRQRQVLQGLARGLTAEQIGTGLSISPRTVRMHSDVLKLKLGVERCRQVPHAYRCITGLDPLGEIAGP
jgi:DNA-binding CsgD family transcriptional regulator